ncbi:MAG TPA: class I SAM-dependent methyltransferase [Verrucomicrobiae bacterium]|jgi:SAM-dependent methyltransferase|nr:class I SAM-dependent methyltransferase [Verrucomicrobiae bacterium]
MLENILRALRFLCTGQFRRVWNEVHVRLYRAAWAVLWFGIMPFRRAGRPQPRGSFHCQTKYPVAFESPDHLAPKGTAVNNSTNKKFVLHMDGKLHREHGPQTLRMLDLGCAGGQTVADFMTLKWQGIGLEGSDFSLKHRRANWARLANTHLFTCDITKPFALQCDGLPARFHLITAWEVMEHIAPTDLDQVFANITAHLAPGGYFIASTTETSDIHQGLELHQTRWTNSEWRDYVARKFPDLEYTDVGLKIHQYVRYNFLHPSFLLYRKKA